MKEIRIHARAGQGAITIARILAIAAFEQGRYALAFPHFGAERMGAPMNAYVRIDEQRIRLRSRVHTPDYVLVVDPTLLASDEFGVFDGLKPGGAAVLNYSGETSTLLGKTGATIYTVPASEIAMEEIGQDRANAPLLGAFAAATGEIDLQSLACAFESNFGPGKLAESNIAAVRRAYEWIAGRST